MKRFLAALLLAMGAAPLATADEALFRAQVAPIFEQHCVNCHHGEKPKGGLALTTRAGLVDGGDSGPTIVPGRAEESLLLDYISGDKPEMPKNGAALDAKQVAAIRGWIDAGAEWPAGLVLANAQRSTERWWAYQPVVRPPVPAVPASPALRSPIDAFVLARLAEKQLAPTPPADKTTLLRRVTFDLTGLPPTPAELDAFLADESDAAFATVVDRLLASPHYGERWGRHWLDVAHYADTHGFESDGRRPNAWRYRDYVIDSLNRDRPYDEFLRQQIAADVLEPNDPAAMPAIGFLGTGSWDKIGHEARAAELRRRARADELDDIVTTVIASTVGLTINCARCHDHKFDPIPQRDYYRLSAVFAGVKHGDRAIRPEVDKQQLAKLQAELAGLKAETARAAGQPLDLADLVAGGNGFGSGDRTHGLDPRSGQPSTGKLGILAGLEANKFVPSQIPFIDGSVVPNGGAQKVPITSTGILIDLPATDGQSWDFIQAGPVLSQDKSEVSGIDYAAAGHSMIALHANKALTFDLDAVRRTYPEFRELRFEASAAYGGTGAGASADFALYVDGQLRAQQKNISYTSGAIPLEVPIAANQRFLTLVATDGGNGISYDQIFFGDPRLVAIRPQSDAPTTPAAAGAQLAERQRALEQQIAGLSFNEQVYAVVPQEAPPTRLLVRGDPETPGDDVTPGGLSVLQGVVPDFGPADMPEGQRRAKLAAWLTDPGNPLVARVMVNRLWHYHFGTGLVATPSDFGFNGDRPSHPELLDWLASELVAQKWSLKQIHRVILLSGTYQQACTANPRAEAIDGGNRLLWRANRRRLEAEAVRDAILATSGKLNRQAGGPGYEDFEYIEKYAPIYKFVVADRPELWRRAVYRFSVRSVPNDWMEALDCPNPSILVPARNRTTTALQALSLLNNPFVLAQAGYFAQRIEHEAGEQPAARVRLAYRLALAREPSAEELSRATEFVAHEGLPALCHLLFNANEFVYVD